MLVFKIQKLDGNLSAGVKGPGGVEQRYCKLGYLVLLIGELVLSVRLLLVFKLVILKFQSQSPSF